VLRAHCVGKKRTFPSEKGKNTLEGGESASFRRAVISKRHSGEGGEAFFLSSSHGGCVYPRRKRQGNGRTPPIKKRMLIPERGGGRGCGQKDWTPFKKFAGSGKFEKKGPRVKGLARGGAAPPRKGKQEKKKKNLLCSEKKRYTRGGWRSAALTPWGKSLLLFRGESLPGRGKGGRETTNKQLREEGRR